jgi:hypothetical protein
MDNLRTRAKLAAKHILGEDVYASMKSGHISTPTILETAGGFAFRHGMNGDFVEDLREGLRVLHETGRLVD